jgi:nitrous-oxide reductase
MVFSQDPFKLIKEIPVGKNPHGTNVSPTNRMVAVCDKLSATQSLIDVDKLKVHRVIPVGAGPLHNQWDTLGKYIYLSCFVSDSTTKVDSQRGQLVDEFPIHYRQGHNSIAPDNAYYTSQNKFSTGLFTPTGIIFAVNFELQDLDETSATYGKTVKLIPVDGEPHEGRQIFASYIQRWNTGKGEELFTKGYDLGDYHVSFDKGPGLNAKSRPQLEPIHVGNSSRHWILRDDGKPGVTKEGDVTVVRIKGFSYGYVPRFIHVPQGAKVRVIFTNIDKAAGLIKNPDVTMGWTPAGYYGPRSMLFSPRGVSVVGEFTADKAGEFEFYCQQFCGPLHLEMRGTLFVDPAGKQASQSIGDYDEISKQEQMLDVREHQWIVGTNKLRNKLNEGNEPVI